VKTHFVYTLQHLITSHFENTRDNVHLTVVAAEVSARVAILRIFSAQKELNSRSIILYFTKFIVSIT
jgi:hypothetical protein